MKIAVNTRLLLKDKLEGIGWFTFETLKRITTQHPEHQFYFFFDRPFNQEFIFSENVTPFVLSPQARHPFLYLLWFEISVALKLKSLKPDLFISPDGYLSLLTRTKSLPVIHDLNFEHYPADLPVLTRWYYRFFFPKFARKAKRIATVSEFSKQDLVKQYDISESKIDVVFNGCNESYYPADKKTQEETKKLFTNGSEYFLFVGALHPRKNITNLFKSFDGFKKAQVNDVKLLIVGQKKWWTEEIAKTFEEMTHKEDVIFTGRLSPEQLKNVLASTLALTYISYFEGFGIPILEGMYSDVPVITSNITSMPEIASDAAILVDPFSVNSIKQAMMDLSGDPELRQQLIEKGRVRRMDFSWQKTADKLWSSIEKAIIS